MRFERGASAVTFSHAYPQSSAASNAVTFVLRKKNRLKIGACYDNINFLEDLVVLSQELRLYPVSHRTGSLVL